MKHYDPDFIEVVKQLITISTPMKQFNGYPPCPWLALGLGKAKILVEKGTDPLFDTERARKQLPGKWGVVYYYNPDLDWQLLEQAYLTTEKDLAYPHTVLWMHDEVATLPQGVRLTGKHPLLIVQDSDMLNYARDNLPPNYPYTRE